MKLLFLFIAMLLSHTAICQNEPGDQAVLIECADSEFAHKCTVAKLSSDVIQLFTPAIAAELRQAGKEYLFVSAVFVTDAEGCVMLAETEAKCDNLHLKNAVLDYISKLPVFQPKAKHYTERRSVHSIDLSFVADESGGGFHVAKNKELWEKLIVPDYIKLDKAPVFKGCEGVENDKDLKCLNIQIRNFLVKNYVVPEMEDTGTIRMFVYFIVYKNGELAIHKIEGGSEPLKSAVRRAINKMPKITPGEMRGIPVDVAFTLPFTVNIG